MQITLNNRKEEFDKESMSISEVLEIKNFSFTNLVIKINGKLIKKDAYSSSIIKAGDKVDIIHMISGG
jgi:sulfur carrier protein